MKVAVIMTVFNRLDKTKECLNTFFKAISYSDYEFNYYFTDDNSNDGTSEYFNYLKNQGYNIKITKGDGNLYWNRGMYYSFEKAILDDNDIYIWINNDVIFKSDSWKNLMNDYLEIKNRNVEYFLITGPTCSKENGTVTYGGRTENGIITPNGNLQECELINGNCVIIDKKTVKKIGNLDIEYEHGLGDFDYSRRNSLIGGINFVASNFIGYCEKNSKEGTWKDPNISIKKRINLMKKQTGQPRKSYKYFLKKWNSKTWFFYYYKPYIDIIITSIGYKIKNKAR